MVRKLAFLLALLGFFAAANVLAAKPAADLPSSVLPALSDEEEPADEPDYIQDAGNKEWTDTAPPAPENETPAEVKPASQKTVSAPEKAVPTPKKPAPAPVTQKVAPSTTVGMPPRAVPQTGTAPSGAVAPPSFMPKAVVKPTMMPFTPKLTNNPAAPMEDNDDGKPAWEPPSNAKWRIWEAGGFTNVLGPREALRTTNGKTEWQAGFTYAKAPRTRFGISYSEFSLRGSARAQAFHLGVTRVLQPWEKWTPLVSFGVGPGHGPDAQSLKHLSGRAGLGMEAFVTRHLSVGLSGDYFYFGKAGPGKSDWHALATSVFVAQRFGYATKPKKKVEPKEEVEESSAPVQGADQIETSTDTEDTSSFEEEDEVPAFSTAPVTTIPGFAKPAIGAIPQAGTVPSGTGAIPHTGTTPSGVGSVPRAGAPGSAAGAPFMPPKAALTPPKGWTANTGGTQAILYVQFQKNKFIIRPEWRDHLRKIAQFLKDHPEAKAFIEGHASSEGSLGFNLRLSRRRANIVRKFLIKNFKIAPKRLVAKGYGVKHPLANNDTEAGRRRNRCAVSYIILKNKPAATTPPPKK